MNWYIAICSLVTGIALGLLIARWGDITRLANKQEEFVDVWLRKRLCRPYDCLSFIIGHVSNLHEAHIGPPWL